MNKEEFTKKVLEIEKRYANIRTNKGEIVREILRSLEEEWENDTKKDENTEL